MGRTGMNLGIGGTLQEEIKEYRAMGFTQEEAFAMAREDYDRRVAQAKKAALERSVRDQFRGLG